MTTTALEVSFALLGKNGEVFGEEACYEFVPRGQLPCKPGDFDGTLLIKCTGQEDLLIRDDLHMLIPSACVAAIAALKQTGTGRFAISNIFQMYTLTRTSDSFLILEKLANSTSPSLTHNYPAEEFEKEMLQCAKRFEKFLRALVLKNKEWQDALASLQQALAQI